MEIYHRIVERIRGAMWAHHRRLMPERQFYRILGYVYNNKYEYQIRLDKMNIVGKEWDGRVEIVTTPAGHITRVRVNPAFQDLSVHEQKTLLLSAYSKAVQEGYKVMQEAEICIYKQFLRDIKPIIMGIRDNPEFFTVSEGSVELPGGTLRSPSSGIRKARTIPYAKAVLPYNVNKKKFNAINYVCDALPYYKHTPQYVKLRSVIPENRAKSAPGSKKTTLALHYPVPYTAMDETRLLRKNWMAFLDNKHVAEVEWTRTETGAQYKYLRDLQNRGQAWHSDVNHSTVEIP